MFNRDLFRAKCIEHGIRTQDAAQIMGINPATLSRKMGGQSDFTRNEIQLFRAALHLTPQETDAIFFCVNLRLRNFKGGEPHGQQQKAQRTCGRGKLGDHSLYA